MVLAMILGSILIAFLAHEGGHSIAAKILTGKWLKFRIILIKSYIPKLVWDMPFTINRYQRMIISAGFMTEFFLSVPVMLIAYIIDTIELGIIYLSVIWIHAVAFRVYACNMDSDWNWLSEK